MCCKQRSTLILTPPCLPVQSRDYRPLRSEPEYVAWAGHTLSETSSGVLPTVLSYTWPVCTSTATRSESSVYTSVPAVGLASA